MRVILPRIIHAVTSRVKNSSWGFSNPMAYVSQHCHTADASVSFWKYEELNGSKSNHPSYRIWLGWNNGHYYSRKINSPRLSIPGSWLFRTSTDNNQWHAMHIPYWMQKSILSTLCRQRLCKESCIAKSEVGTKTYGSEIPLNRALLTYR